MAGQIIEATGDSGTVHYTYDKAGLLESQTDEEGGESSYYSYDNSGRRIRLVSGNRDVAYAYGKNGELLEVADTMQSLFVDYRYDDMMREMSRTFGNGVVQYTEYDSIGRTTLITEKSRTREILRAEGYVYDDEGRRTHSVNETGQVTKYLYDVQGRLETVYYPYSEEKSTADKNEAKTAGLFYTGDNGDDKTSENIYLVGRESTADSQESATAGFLFSRDNGRYESLYLSSAEVSNLKSLLGDVSFGRGRLVTAKQNVWKESYTL